VCGYADYKQFQFDLVDKFVERGECCCVGQPNVLSKSMSSSSPNNYVIRVEGRGKRERKGVWTFSRIGNASYAYAVLTIIIGLMMFPGRESSRASRTNTTWPTKTTANSGLYFRLFMFYRC